MKQLNYKVINKYSNIRRENWKDFVSIIQWEKKHKMAIISLHFNNFGNMKYLLEYLEQETTKYFDIVIIENSTKSEEEHSLKIYCEWKNNITIIKPVHNIWSAGGYALGMEYIINQDYEYFFIVEDDVIFLEQNIFSNMIKYADKNTLNFIYNCKNTRSSWNPKDKWKSRRVQTAGYPINFIKEIGVIDPRYFFRGEDLERWERIKQGIKKFWYRINISDYNYLHPYLKSVNGNYAWFYFSIRNQLLSLQKHFTKNYTFFIILFFYLWTALTKVLVNKDTLILKSFKDAIKDFLWNRYSFENNKKKIGLFLKSSTNKETHTWINNEELWNISKNLYSNTKILTITWADREKLKFSKNIWNIWRYWILTSSSSTIFTPLLLLAPKTICINEFNLTNNNISVTQYKNKNIIWNILLIIISLVVSLGIIIIVDVIIILYIGFNRLYKKKC